MSDVPNRSYLGTPATAPGPSGPQMLTATPGILRDPLAFLAGMRDRYGDVVQFPIPRPPSYLAASPEATHRVLVAGTRVFDKDTVQYRALSLVTGDGLLTARLPRWRADRPVVQPAFHHSLLPRLGEIVAEETAATVQRWRRIGRASVVDVEPGMLALTLRVVGRALFGDDLTGRTASLAEATITALEVLIRRAQLPLPDGWPTPGHRRLRAALADLDEAAAALISQRQPLAGRSSPLLLDLLLTAPGWTPQQVRDQVITFLVAGHETAASALTWALGLLAGDADVQRACANDHDYAAACADEALRLFPPAWVITRTAVADTEVAGRRIPAGGLVITSPAVLGRDPRVWDDPLRFDPGRFTAGLTGPQRRAYLPFGAGLRQCIGREFARWQLPIVLGLLCRAFTWTPVTGQLPRALPGVTLRPAGGMPLALAAR